jgi:hypothetical protein
MARSDALGGGATAGEPQVVVGTELAGYRIESLLGRGGMGVVYRARDLALDRNVALKLLAPELAEDVRFRERFLRESRLAASLDHPAIIPIYDAGEVAGQLYIAMRTPSRARRHPFLSRLDGRVAFAVTPRFSGVMASTICSPSLWLLANRVVCLGKALALLE